MFGEFNYKIPGVTNSNDVNNSWLKTAINLALPYSQITNPVNQTITLTGDITGSGTASFATTLATVNSNIGTFTYGTFTVNGKGLITAASSGNPPSPDYYSVTYCGGV